MSSAGGAHKAIDNALAVEARAFALFVKPQRRWKTAPIKQKDVELFHHKLNESEFSPSMILPHGSYLVNLGSADPEIHQKSMEGFIDELNRVSQLGLQLLNIHPGSTAGKCSIEESIERIGESINVAHEKTMDSGVMVVLENTAGGGNTIGRSFEELNSIMALVKDQSRLGVCLDTCHLHSAGYNMADPRQFKQVWDDFENQIGFDRLVGMHWNDSKTEFHSNKDRHENIGNGSIGLDVFRSMMNDTRFENIPLLLETPNNDGEQYSREIQLLNSMKSL